MNLEVANFLARLDDLRGQISELIRDLPAEALNWRPVEGEADHSANSIAVLAAHTAGAETFWIHEVIGRREKMRVRELEFETRVEGPNELIARLAETGRISAEVFGNLVESDLGDTRPVDGKQVPVRWGILHVVDHTALHLGHMQITFQLWNGGKGVRSPRWFQRI